MSSAVIVGVLCSVLNGWLLNKQRQESCNNNQSAVVATPDPQSLPVVQPPGNGSNINPILATIGARRTARNKPHTTRINGFDNPNWVYGDGNPAIHTHPEPMAAAEAETKSRQMAISIISTPERATMRYATIRRAPSLMTSLPLREQNAFTSTTCGRNQLKSASFRLDQKGQRGQRNPAVAIQRSKTMRETTFTVAAAPSPPPASAHTFGQRFQSDLEGTSALSFVHDSVEEEDEMTMQDQVNQTEQKQSPVAKAVKQAQVPPPPPPPPPPPLPPALADRRNVHKSDKIVLRVESFRTIPIIRNKPIPVPGTLDRLAATRNNTPRVSSSTQTELSVLRGSGPGSNGSSVHRSNTKRSTAGSPIKVSIKTPGNSPVPTSSLPQNSPVESSSGYSSPRSTESKSPTPEPSPDVTMTTLPPIAVAAIKKESRKLMAARDNYNSEHINVTVIQIDPSSSNSVARISKGRSIQQQQHESMYATPIKRSDRTVMTSPLATQTESPGFRVSIQSKPSATIHRSVSFHQLSQSGRRAVYSNEWKAGPPQPIHGPHHPQVMSIPRPALRVSHIQHHQQQQGYTTLPTAAVLRRSTSHRQLQQQSITVGNSTLSRSSSMYLAMSEIQRKLDLLQMITSARHHLAAVPVHHQSQTMSSEDLHNTGGNQTLPNPDHARRKNGGSSSSSRTRSTAPSTTTLKTSLSAADLLDDNLDSAKTLAYLSELEMLARHWRQQLSHKVSPPSQSVSSSSINIGQQKQISNNNNKKELLLQPSHHVASIDYRQVELKSASVQASKKTSTVGPIILDHDDAFQC